MQPRDIGIILLIGLIVACLVSTVPFVSEQSYGEINAKRYYYSNYWSRHLLPFNRL